MINLLLIPIYIINDSDVIETANREGLFFASFTYGPAAGSERFLKYAVETASPRFILVNSPAVTIRM